MALRKVGAVGALKMIAKAAGLRSKRAVSGGGKRMRCSHAAYLLKVRRDKASGKYLRVSCGGGMKKGYKYPA